MKRDNAFAALRIAFGFVWAIDATFKWMPAIRLHIVDVLSQAQQGQPGWEYNWIEIWVRIASIHPVFFGTMIAVIETLLAISLITGVCSRFALYGGVFFAFLIWSVPQGFGGPYQAGVTDVDSGLIYVLLFLSLIVGEAWNARVLFAKK